MKKAGGGKNPALPSVDRLQGTDGLRGRMGAPGARPEDPIRAFLEEGILTEPLAELYAFAASRWLLERAGARGPGGPGENAGCFGPPRAAGASTERALSHRPGGRGGIANPGALVLARDPRDPEGRFTQAALRGVRKAGGEALVAGVLPTPAAALSMAREGGAGALVVTASHNPADENGIKVFLGGEARKPLPEEDEEISRRALGTRWADVEGNPLGGSVREVASEAREAYRRFFLENHRGLSLAPFRLALDVSGGAWGGLAAPLLRELRAREVHEVNPPGARPVNEGGGVVMLEGRSRVAGSEESLIEGHGGLRSLFNLGRLHRESLRRGEGWAALGVLDADGDRCLSLFYDPFEDASLILGGDEMAVLIARLRKARGDLPPSPLSACTIDSDPGATGVLASLGFEVVLTPVGDKWLLREAERAGRRFALGAEASGHLVMRGRVQGPKGEEFSLALGDGLGALIRTLEAVDCLLGRLPPEKRYAELREPFPRSFKETLYVYYTDRARFFRGSPAWREARALLEREAEGAFGARGYSSAWTDLPDDPNTLFLSLRDAAGFPRASLFVRNSGTEARTGLTLQGPREDAGAFEALAAPALRTLIASLKDEGHPYARVERKVLERLGRGPAPEADLSALVGPGVNWPRLRREMVRGGLLAKSSGGLSPTPLGRSLIRGKGPP